MGESALTPEQTLLAKALTTFVKVPAFAKVLGQRGTGNSGKHSETCSWGTEAVMPLTKADQRVVWPGESSLFSLT